LPEQIASGIVESGDCVSASDGSLVVPHVCPWWGGYFIDNYFRRWLHHPERILSPYVRPGMKALDFGCGMGIFAITMAQLVAEDGRVIAVDLQQQMLDVLSKRAARAGVGQRIHTHRCSANSLDLNEAVDFALAFYSAHEVPDAARLLVEVYELLIPHGQFLIAEPVGHVLQGAFARMLDQAKEVGFEIRERPAIRLSHAALLVKQVSA
jgi:cyclopropane fatty-acyl-phospholipid synthase-like methyltransferase